MRCLRVVVWRRYDDTQCTVNSTVADAGLLSLPHVHKIHIKNGKCVVKVEEEPLPTLPPTAVTTTPTPTEQTTTTPTPTEAATTTTPTPIETTTPTVKSEESGAEVTPPAAEPETGVSEEVAVN